jgi:hypothetical protein
MIKRLDENHVFFSLHLLFLIISINLFISFQFFLAGWVFVPHPSLEKMLHTLGLKISEVVGYRCPDIMNQLIEVGLWKQMFSFFHLFMCPADSSPPHLDDGDWFAVIFLIHCEEGLPNSLTIESGVNISFNMRIDDVVLLDTNKLNHGSPFYDGQEDPSQLTKKDRLVGIFILKQEFLRLKGMSCELLRCETYDNLTIPDQLHKKQK